jgi:hypothetical protein
MKVFALCLALVILLSANASAQKEDLLFYLPFHEGKGAVAKDASGNGHDGKIEGKPEWIEGPFDKALFLNGTDAFVQIPLEDDLTFTEDSSFTAALWLNSEVAAEPAQDGVFGNYRQSTTPFWGLLIRPDGTLIYYLRNGGSITPVSKGPVNDGKWHHIAFYRDRNTKKAGLYVDAKLEEEMNDPTGNIDSGQDIYLGEHLNRFFEGAIDEAMLFSRALTSKEIQKVMDGGLQAVSHENNVASVWGTIKMDR